MLESQQYLEFTKRVKDDIGTYEFLSSRAWDLTLYSEDVVGYITGFVIKSLYRCITCNTCKIVLESDTAMTPLQRQKQHGRLIKAPPAAIRICSTAEKYFRFFNKTKGIFNKNIKNLVLLLTTNTMENIPFTVMDSFSDHLFEDDISDGHCLQMIRLILKTYFKLRIHHEISKMMDLLRSKDRIRSLYTKTILFKHQ
nr:unnamed protein product [Callosobruchus analis]